MAKAKTVFVCNNCGYESAKWLGKCPACNEWNTFFEEKISKDISNGTDKKTKSVKQQKKVDALTREEQYILEQYLNSHKSKYNNIILLCLYTRYAHWGSISFND